MMYFDHHVLLLNDLNKTNKQNKLNPSSSVSSCILSFNGLLCLKNLQYNRKYCFELNLKPAVKQTQTHVSSETSLPLPVTMDLRM